MTGQKPVDYLMKGKALIEAGKADEAVSILSKPWKAFLKVRIYLVRAEAFMAKGDYSRL